MISMYNCDFDYYRGDKLCSSVSIRAKGVTCRNYTDNVIDRPFGIVPDHRINAPMIRDFFAERCTDENNAGIRQYLDHIGLKEYDPFEICRISDGKLMGSKYRIEWRDNIIQ